MVSSTYEPHTHPIASALTPDDTQIEASHADFVSAARRLPLPDSVRPGAINWPYLITIVGVHAASLAALVPWAFSWTGLIIALVGVHAFGQAINLCYHRVLAHRSAVLPKWLEHTFVVMALCCFQDTPAKWVAMHRIHHKHSDEQPDPHSPLVGFLWSHMGWLLVRNEGTHSIAAYQKYASDVLRDRFYMSLEKSYKWLWIWIGHVALFGLLGVAIGATMTATWQGALRMGVSLVVWGVFVRTVLVWHITWSVNSLTHLFGYANYRTDDHSRNNWLVALLTVGEGWHNNHHHDPVSASNQRRWWELDITYYQIRLLERVGLAERVMRSRHVRHADLADPVDRAPPLAPRLDSAPRCDAPRATRRGRGANSVTVPEDDTRDSVGLDRRRAGCGREGVARTPKRAWAVNALSMLFLVISATLLIPRFRDGFKGVAEESFVVDLASPWVLLVALGCFVLAALRVRSGRSVLLVFWLGLVCALMALRELDLHAVINPPNMPLLGLDPEHGVRFRIDWWIGAETPAGVRIAWAAIGFILLAAIVLPFAVCRFPWYRKLRGRNRFAWLVVASLGLMAGGYVIDDLVARTLTDPRLAEAIEESLELSGQILLAATAALLAFRPQELAYEHDREKQ